MADSGAVRQARLRLHRAGDHTMCKRGNCPDLTALVAELAPGAFALALEQLVTGLGLEPGDPRLVDIAMCRALAPGVDQGSTAAVRQVREILAGVTLQRPKADDDPPDSVDIAIARRQARRADVRRRAAAGEFGSRLELL